MNSLKNDWDITRRAELSYFNCGPSNQNEYERKVQTRKKIEDGKVKEKHSNIYPYVYIHTPTDTQTYILADTDMHIYTLFIIQVR